MYGNAIKEREKKERGRKRRDRVEQVLERQENVW